MKKIVHWNHGDSYGPNALKSFKAFIIIQIIGVAGTFVCEYQLMKNINLGAHFFVIGSTGNGRGRTSTRANNCTLIEIIWSN